MAEAAPLPDPNEDASADFMQARRARMREDMLRELDEMESGGKAAGETPAPRAGAGGGERPGFVPRAAADIGRGITEAPEAVYNGVVDAAAEVSGMVWDATLPLATWLAANVGSIGDPGAGFSSETAQQGANNVKADAPESVTGGLVQGVAQFLTGFIPAVKGVQAARTATTLAGKAGQTLLASSLAEVAAIDEHDARLSNLVQKFPALENPVTEYLAAEPDDGFAEGKFKQALEGLGVGAIGEGVVLALRALKGANAARVADDLRVDDQVDVEAPDAEAPKAESDLGGDGVARDYLAFGSADDGPVVKIGEKETERAKRLLARLRRDQGSRTADDIDAAEAAEAGGAVREPGAKGRPVKSDFGKFVGYLQGARMPSPASFAGAAVKMGGMTDDFLRDALKGEAGVPPGLLRKSGKTVEELREEMAASGWGIPNTGDDLADNRAFVEMLADDVRGIAKVTHPDDAPLVELGADVDDAHKMLGDAGLDAREMSDKAIADFFEAKSTAVRGLDDLEAEAEALKDAGLDGEEIKRLASAGDRAVNINLANIDGADDILRAIDETADLYRTDINARRRDVMTQAATGRLADSLGMTPADLLARRKGEAFNAEQALAARRIMVASADNLQRLAKLAANPEASDAVLARFRRAAGVHAAIQKQVSGLTAEAGRALQAFRIPAEAGRAQIEAVQAFVQAEGRADLQKMAVMVGGLGDVRGVNALTKDLDKPTTTDALLEAWKGALLSSPTTHAVNVLSNAMVTFWTPVERLGAAGVNKALGGDGVEVGEALAQTFGMVQGMKQGFILAARAIRTGETSDAFNKIEMRSRAPAFTAETFGAKSTSAMGMGLDLVGEAFRVPFRLLGGADEFFKAVNYRMELNAVAYRTATQEGLSGGPLAERIHQIVTNPPEAMRNEAIDAARINTFTAPLGEAGGAFQRGLQKAPALQIIVPFFRTPVNILKYVGVRSPLAPLAKSVRADVAAGGARRDLAIAKMSLGTGFMAIAAEMQAGGLITGGGPVDAQLKQSMVRNGWQPYSVRVGNKWVSYSRTDPLGLMLGIAADASELMGQAEGADAEELAGAAVLALSGNMVNKTYLRGLAEVVEVANSRNAGQAAYAGERYISGLLGSSVPSVVGHVARQIDPTMRDARGVVDTIRSRIPGYSESMPPRRDLWGKPIVRGGAFGPDWVSPLYQKEGDSGRPIDQEMIRLGMGVDNATRQVRGVELQPDEYSDYAALSGNDLKNPENGLGLADYLDALVEGRLPESAEYAALSDGPDGGKALVIRDAVLRYREAARGALVAKHPRLRELIQENQLKARRALEGRP